MFKFQIDVKFDKLSNLTPAVRKEAAAIVKRNAEECRDNAKREAPVDTGKLRDSIDAQPDGPLAWVVGPHTDYDLYVELGTSRMPAKPFLVPATERQRPRFFADMQGLVERAARG